MNIHDILQKPWVIPTAVGAGAFGGGLGLGYILGRRNVLKEWSRYLEMKEAVDETNSYLDSLKEKASDDMEVLDTVEVPQPEPDVEEELVDVEEIIDEVNSNVSEQIDYNKVEPEDEDEPEVEVTVVRNVFQSAPDDQWVYDDEIALREQNPGDPYVIHHDEFMNNEKDYSQETLTYYKGDDIVADQEDKPIYNYAGLMGSLKFGHGSGDPNVVYIRNDSIHMEWEVLLHESSFEVEVMGLVVEEQYEEADIKHANVRRFRPD